MKTFYGETFIEKNILKEAGIQYPIKLEYYKRINKEEMNDKQKYGISIVKTEYKSNGIKTEEKAIKYLSNDEKKTNNILKILKENCVTPLGLEDVIADFF